MKKKNSHLFFTLSSFFFPLIIYLKTMAPTTSFWDCGEFIACSVTLGVPHPPGTPLFLLLGNVFSQIPIFSDIGARVNFISPIASAFSVMFLYLIIIHLIKRIIGEKQENSDYTKKIKIAEYSGFIAAVTFAFTDSQWFNAVESEVYALSTLLTSMVVWLILKWDTISFNKDSIKYIIIISYVMGLSIGIHLLNLLAIPCIIFIIYYNARLSNTKYENIYKIIIDTLKVSAISLVIFATIYIGIIKGIPKLSASIDQIMNPLWFPIICYIFIFACCCYYISNQTLINHSNRHRQSITIIICLFMILIGYSTYSTIFIRASQHPSINENNPDSSESFLYYMEREQYGSWSILDRKSTLQRQENMNWKRYTNDRDNPSGSEVLSFVWNYQIKEMYLRYFAWQFIGRGDFDWNVQNKDGTIIKKIEGINWTRYIIPFAFILGLVGFFYHFRNDYFRAISILSLFLATGILIILYLNQYDPQPRERDYSYVGSFFAFSIWIGIGVFALIDKITNQLKDHLASNITSVGLALLLLIAMPINMLAKDYNSHDRSGNFVAWDYAYNLLNSCEPNSILFTNGDNDTFPLWYIQEVENIRKDVRVVNLSLLNTPWYIKQLKNEYKTLPINLEDSSIESLDPLVGTAFALQKWTSEWDRLNSGLNNYFMEQYNQRYNILNHGIPVEWGPVDAVIDYNGHKIDFQLRPTFSNYLKVQDIMVLELIDDMPIDRPVYFAVTVSPGHRLGLDSYLEMEGLVYKFTPEKNIDNSMYPRLNINQITKNITQTTDINTIIKTGEDYINLRSKQEGIYRYRNLNNEEIFFSHNIERLVQNYRSSFLQIAIELISDVSKYPEVNNILIQMENYFPIDVIKIAHPDVQIQVGNLFNAVGNMDMFNKYMIHASNRNDLDIQQSYTVGQLLLENSNDTKLAVNHFYDMLIQYSDVFEIYQSLSLAYIKNDQIDAAIKLIEDWILLYPKDSKAIEWLNLIKNQS
tara:strand:- start:4239 stop:7181 length:2943 start_codon:yes stop_codon:yes gene_type:complete